MGKKIKLKKKKTDVQGENESKRGFILRTVTPIESSVVLTGDEEEVTNRDNLQILRGGFQIDDRAFRSGLMRIEENEVGGFANLDEETKDALARRFATSPTNVQSQFPEFWDRVRNGYQEFHSPMVTSRRARFRWCSALIYNACMPATASVVIGTMLTNNFWILYTEFGIESLADDGLVSLSDYIKSTEGTIFEGAGLLENITGNMIPNTILEAELITRIENCIELGDLYKLNE